MKQSLTISLLLISFAANAQFQWQPSFGFQFRRIIGDSTIHIPTFPGVPTLRGSTVGNKSAIGFDSTNNKFYKAAGTSSSSDWVLVN